MEGERSSAVAGIFSKLFFCETRSRARGLRAAPSNASQKSGLSKGSFINEAERGSHPVRQPYQCLAKAEDQPSPVDGREENRNQCGHSQPGPRRAGFTKKPRLRERLSESRC